MKIRFAVTPPTSVLNEQEYPRYLEECEHLGFDTIWLSDIPLGDLGDPLISLSYAAAHTTRLKLGANLVPLGRHPLWLAKQLAHLDRLSNGRLLISLVPGLGSPDERAALGYTGGDRGQVIDEMIALMRQWWAGQTVSGDWENLSFSDTSLAPLPIQQPLEIWLGGASASALERVAQIADGWLTSAITPVEAENGKRKIETRAAELGRTVDEEHFGISMPYATHSPDSDLMAALSKRRKDKDLSQVVALGDLGLKELINAHIDGGLSKFVMRPIDSFQTATSWRSNLRWLADAVLPMQT